ncbi:MAG: aminoacyl-tRNA hydrolase [Patescibacteria group bacterium]
MLYIIGLGNSGEKYENTRHNVGFVVVDLLRDNWGFESWKLDRYVNSFLSCGVVEGEETVLVKPNTYMNNSGKAVSGLLKKREMRADQCVLVHDEIDLPLGFVKMSFARGEGGHRGVRSVVNALGTKDILRIRVGILPEGVEQGSLKRVGGKNAVERFILGNFNREEREGIIKAGGRVKEYLETLIREDREKAVSSCKG